MNVPHDLSGMLRQPGAYPHDPSAARGISHAETESSELFRTGERVYKFRKPLGATGVLTRRASDGACLREVALNQRLAPDVYLGVAPLLASDAGVGIGPTGETLRCDREAAGHAVVMRRLPDGCDGESLARRGALTDAHIDALATRLARFHAQHRMPRFKVPRHGEEWWGRITGTADASVDALSGHVGSDLLDRVRAGLRRNLRTAESWLAARRASGLLVDGHGDLRLAHVWFEGLKRPAIIGCAAFDESRRCSDPAMDLGFLAMDLLRLGRPEACRGLLQRYALETDDFGVFAVIDYAIAQAACHTAQTELLRGRDGEAAHPARTLVELAGRVLREDDAPTVFVLSDGAGSGKTTAADVVARTMGGIVVAGDHERPRSEGIRHGSRAARHAIDPSRTMYAEVLARAEPVLDSRRHVVLDAAFAQSVGRECVRAWAERRRAPLVFVETRSDAGQGRAIGQRRIAGGRCGAERHHCSGSERASERTSQTGERHLVVSTDAERWRVELVGDLHALRDAG